MGVVQQKLRAFAIHFAISLTVIGTFLAFVYFILYTPEILHLEGGDRITAIIFAVDLTLGPIMTLILYRQGKKGLLFDLALVGLLQASAFLYGGWTLYSQRPVYIAFIKEHFEIVPLGTIDIKELKDQSLYPGLLRGPRVVFVERPTGDTAQQIMLQALGGGKDVHLLPEYYRPFEENLPAVRERTVALEKLRKERPEAARAVEETLRELGKKEAEVLLYPVMAHAQEGAMLLDRTSGDVLKYLEIVIW